MHLTFLLAAARGRGFLAEFERELIRARTGEGRKRAKARGVRFGRPRKTTPHQRQEALQRLAAGETQADVGAERDADGLGDLFAAHSALDQILDLLHPLWRELYRATALKRRKRRRVSDGNDRSVAFL